ncbi:Tol-Pal system beta propeller repeat protein TolB [Neptunomonas antarctica]|uniref:Tol-Pal system protein TolB n=1 Tax=Neptunomonas antarctica TaxID=619304 RepID=A0A1N7KB19_9GAMM|nr:Tol-Pal system beta propeller repeat protein TolB [Neptunomonas antarctica]SIS58795.1 TolB protein [Neptunomonas antarctica]
MVKQLLAGFVLLLSTLTVRAELVVEVTQGVDAPSPVAIVPFDWSGSALSEDVAKIVSDDLGRSGFFKMMPRENMLSTPHERSQVFFRDWRISNNDYIVIGRLIPAANGQITATIELYDVLKEQLVWSETVNGNSSNLRDVAHYIADQVFQQLTGIKGAFSTRIVYVTAEMLGKDKYRYRLQMADSDGARPRTILESKEPILSPTWSKDGSKLAYVSFESTRPSIYVQHLATGQRQRIQSFKGLNGAPAWSPQGDRLALVLSKDGNPEIYVLTLATGQLDRLTRHYGIDTEPTWSPDGESILFTSDRGGMPQIYSLHLPSRDLKRLTFEGKYNSRGRLTQDGRFLTMVHQDSDGFHIAVQDLKSGRVDILTSTGLDESPTIAPNGSIILYATKKGGRGVLAGVSLDGRVRFTMPNTQGDVREPAWSPFLQ